MFSSIFKEVTGYFDKHALVTAFMPMLIAWALVLGVSLFLSGRSGDAGGWWKGRGIPAKAGSKAGTNANTGGGAPTQDATENKSTTAADISEQVLVFLAFLVCVAFSSFIVLNFQAALVRLYIGYDLNVRFVTPLFQRKRRKWKELWEKNDDELRRLSKLSDKLKDIADGKQISREEISFIEHPFAKATATNLHAFLRLLNSRLKSQKYIPRIRRLSASALIVAYVLIQEYLKALDDKDFLKEVNDIPLGRIKKFVLLKDGKMTISGHQVDLIRSLSFFIGFLWETPRAPVTNVELYRQNLVGNLQRLKQQAAQQRSVVEVELQSRDRDRFYNFPPHDDDVMPTRFGNVIRAAEAYPEDRYKLSASLVWVWLEPLLPKEASKPLYDAKTSLDLMITCSTLILLVGLPLSTWAGIKYAGYWYWWTPLIPALLVFLVRCSTLLWNVVGLFALTQWVLQLLNVPNQLEKLNVLITLVTSVILISWLCYQSAVQAALSYGERYRVAFDQHRWKILEALHLQLPRNLEDERELWERVGKVLYRASDPDPYYWSYTKQPTTREPGPLIPFKGATRPVPRTNLNKTLSIDKDKMQEYFEERPIKRDEEWIDAVQTMAELEGKKLLEPLWDGRLIPRSAIGQTAQTVAVGVPVTMSTLMGGLVRPDDIVDLILIPASPNGSPPLDPLLFANVRVIAVRSASPANTANENSADQEHVVVVALPVERRYEFAIKSVGAKFILSWSGKSATPQADEEVAGIKILQGRTKTSTL